MTRINRRTRLMSINPLGRVTTNAYDALNRLVSVIDPYKGATKPTTYLYDQAGNLTKVTDPQGLDTTYTYNGHNNLITQVSPDTGTTKFGYNATGNVTTKLDAAGRCTVTAYDTLNRASSVKYIASATAATCIPTTTATAAETVSYTYDSITATVGGAGAITVATGCCFKRDLSSRRSLRTNVA